MDLAAHYFGELEAGDDPPPVDPAPPAPFQAETRLLLEDRVELPRLYLVVAFALDLRRRRCRARSGGRGAGRAERRRDSIGRSSTRNGWRPRWPRRRARASWAAIFQIIATAAPGRTLAELERAISDAIESLVDEGPTSDEMERCQAQAEAQFRLPAADRWRLRRQVGSIERLQRLCRRPRFLRPGSGSIPARHGGLGAARCARLAAARTSCAAQRRAERTESRWRLPVPSPVSVS